MDAGRSFGKWTNSGKLGIFNQIPKAKEESDTNVRFFTNVLIMN